MQQPPTDPLQVERAIKKAPHIYDKMIQSAIVTAIENYPADSPGKRFAQKALEQCTQESLRIFFMVGIFANLRQDMPMGRQTTALLKSEDGYSAEAELMRSVTASYRAEASPMRTKTTKGVYANPDGMRKVQDRSEGLGRRAFLKRMGALVGGGGLLAAEVHGGFTTPDGHHNGIKDTRVAAEIFAALALAGSGSKDALIQNFTDVITLLDPYVRKEAKLSAGVIGVGGAGFSR